jgi:hypothetical protein
VHKETEKKILLPIMDNEERKYYRLRKKAICNLKYWKQFFTLTYSDKYLPGDISQVRKDIRMFFNKVVLYNKRGYFHVFKVPKLCYIWRIEQGTEGTQRFHIHILWNIRFLKKEIEKIWDKGYVFFRNIYNPKEIVNYISKYISKKGNCSYKGKIWGSSRNLNKPSSKWILLGVLLLTEEEYLVKLEQIREWNEKNEKKY